MENNSTLLVQDVEIAYDKVKILWGVSLSVDDKEIVTLIGPNGAGKTTLLKAVSGQLRPVRGSIHFKGERISELPPHEITQKGVALVPEGRQIFPGMSVYENLRVGAYRQKNSKDIKDTLEWVLGIFPILKERLSQRADRLSGGEQQMLAIGRALMARPSLLMIDEPSTGLAPLVVRKVFDLLKQLILEGVTMLLVEQNAHLALELADRGYLIENGRVVLEGSSAELMHNPTVRSAYLGA